MTAEREVRAIAPDGGFILYRIRYKQVYPRWTLSVISVEGSVTEYDGPDLYWAMQDWRRHLEQCGQTLLCQGARPAVFPSAMASDMGGGIKAYVNQLPPYRESLELIDIFDEASPEEVGTVQQQEDFRKQWAEAFHQRGGTLGRIKRKAQSLWWKVTLRRGKNT